MAVYEVSCFWGVSPHGHLRQSVEFAQHGFPSWLKVLDIDDFPESRAAGLLSLSNLGWVTG